ncbi:MAG: hypothetical protein O3B01_15600 [Planctomycetota bacterium]|nr:hypothetical protein [Planctomycetota bacterium]MDA1140000.1 hypothetical protein [Planctomycetota bacterium]
MNTHPEHIHLIINHIPILGPAFAILPLVYFLVTRSKDALLLGLFITVISTGSMRFVMWTGELSEERVSNQLQHLVDDEGHSKWKLEHWERASVGAKVLYMTLVLSITALVFFKRLEKHHLYVGIANLLLSGLCLGMCIWIADAGGKIHHPEFREGFEDYRPDKRTPKDELGEQRPSASDVADKQEQISEEKTEAGGEKSDGESRD